MWRKFYLFFQSSSQSLSFLDCTFGRGGHSLALLKALPEARVLALDQDEEAIVYGQRELVPFFKGRLKLLKANFHNFSSSSRSSFDGILMDLGASSPQLEGRERGFSFYQRGPLDMRMDRSQPFKASDIVNNSSEEELTALFKEYGEIANPYPVVSDLLKRRKKKDNRGDRRVDEDYSKTHPLAQREIPSRNPLFFGSSYESKQRTGGIKKQPFVS